MVRSESAAATLLMQSTDQLIAVHSNGRREQCARAGKKNEWPIVTLESLSARGRVVTSCAGVVPGDFAGALLIVFSIFFSPSCEFIESLSLSLSFVLRWFFEFMQFIGANRTVYNLNNFCQFNDAVVGKICACLGTYIAFCLRNR